MFPFKNRIHVNRAIENEIYLFNDIENIARIFRIYPWKKDLAFLNEFNRRNIDFNQLAKENEIRLLTGSDSYIIDNKL